ncbi:hypothetical protein QJS10_CPA06g00707 [Acorus calamus]|uniref:Uncharacterized protein n=1 Tax=Acorus calamus TaxID=4465 RepID=A0AAV9EJF3_ACOCL|nr:hypothetical protein QJS10_CPA06g00707 [Acorus calamus]
MSLASATPFSSYDSSIEVGAKDQKLMMDFQQAPKKGGLKTMPFIMGCEHTSLLANMINYLKKDYHMNAAKGGTVLFSGQPYRTSSRSSAPLSRIPT